MTDEQPVDALTAREVDALAGVYWQPLNASQLLARAGLPESKHPMSAPNASMFWQAVNTTLASGALPGGRRKILELALADYPANPAFIAGHRAAVDAGTAQRATGTSLPRHGIVLALDAVGYSRLGTDDQETLREGLWKVAEAALAEIGADAEYKQDQGDGFFTVIPATVPKARVVVDFVRELTIALHGYNRTKNDHGRLRLRVALHEGDVRVSRGTGWTGNTVVVAARLLNCGPVRAALARYERADLALMLSPSLYESVVAEGLRGARSSDYLQVEVVEGIKYRGTGWLTVPGHGAPDLPNDSDGRQPGSGGAGPNRIGDGAMDEGGTARTKGAATSGDAAGSGADASNSSAPVVFLSYAHESPAHDNRVLELYRLLRRNGVEAVIDRVAERHRQDWPQWMGKQLRRADFVLVIASAEYWRRAEGESPSKVGRGLQHEARLIRDMLYADNHKWFPRILPILFEGHTPEEIPAWLGTYSAAYYEIATVDRAGCRALLRVLLDKPAVTEEPLGPRPQESFWNETTAPTEVGARTGTASADDASSSTAFAHEPAGESDDIAPVAEPPLRDDGTRWDFFVSAAQADEGWGGWITWYLEEQNYTVRFQLWDEFAGNDQIKAQDQSVRESKRTVAVLSKSYLEAAGLVGSGWHAAFRRDPNGSGRTLIPIRVEDCDPDGLLGSIRYIDLVGLTDEAARDHLVEQIRRSVAGYYRPSGPPPFPGRRGS
jgi:hypothetical protein